MIIYVVNISYEYDNWFKIVRDYQNFHRHTYRMLKKLRLQRFRDDSGGKNKVVFYLTKLWLMHSFAARWSYG